MSTEAVVFVKDLLEARFPAEEVRQDYRGNDYVEDERVMDRLTDVLGNENWHVADATAISDRVVRLSVAVRWPGTTEWLTYTDFGYPNKTSAEEPLKEAWTDAFRRVGRLVGVARYLYLGEGPAGRIGNTQGQAVTAVTVTVPQVAAASAATPPVAPAAPQQPEAAASLPLPPGTVRYQDIEEHGKCPDHGLPWTIKPGGISQSGPRAGQSYNAFYKCDGKTGNQFCKQKPPKAWADAHPIAG
jgi:hypothetical protein